MNGSGLIPRKVFDFRTLAKRPASRNGPRVFLFIPTAAFRSLGAQANAFRRDLTGVSAAANCAHVIDVRPS